MVEVEKPPVLAARGGAWCRLPGFRRFCAQDPFGNRPEFLQPVR
jgi:hypothetical protein